MREGVVHLLSGASLPMLGSPVIDLLDCVKKEAIIKSINVDNDKKDHKNKTNQTNQFDHHRWK